MISQAVIMPSLAAAVFRLGDEFRALRLGADGAGVDCSRQVGSLLVNGADRALTVANVSDEAALLAQLRMATTAQRALTFVLAVADSELSADNRVGSLACAERLLRDGSVVDFVRRRLLGCSPPPEADFAGARDLARKDGCRLSEALYQDVLKFRSVIELVIQTLKDVLFVDHMGEYDPQAVLHTLVDNGVVAEAVIAFGSRDRQRASLLPVQFGQHSVLQSQVKRLAHLLTEFSRKLVQHLPAGTAIVPQPTPQEENARPQDPWLLAVEEWLEERREKKSRHGAPAWLDTTRVVRTKDGESVRLRSPYGAEEKLAKVEKQVEFVTRFIKVGGESLDNAVLDLIAHQKRSSEPEHLCMTLSLLGHQATERGEFDLAFRLYRVAQLANDGDPAAFCGYAETLRTMGELEDALTAYAEAKQRFPDNEVSVCGYAETLRTMGRLDEALTAYDEAKQRFPSNEVPICGYAETLRTMGQLEDALAAYAEAKQRFPDNEVPVCGYAETLRTMGRLEDALAAYADAKQRFPDDEVPVCGYAETLRTMGRLDEALTAYNEAKQRFPDNEVPVCGYAETLRELGRLEDALTAYDKAKGRFGYVHVVFCGYAATLRTMGRLEEALAAYADAKQRFPHDEFAVCGSAETLRMMGRLEKALTEYAETRRRFPEKQVPVCGYAETLRELGRLEDALTAYAEAKQRFGCVHVPFCGYAETLRTMGRLEEALAAYDVARQRFPSNVVPFCGYAETLRELGRADEALKVYDQLSQRFAWSRVVRTSLVCLLVEAGDFQRARTLLRTGLPSSRDDWWDFHVGAMIGLWGGNSELARRQLEFGVRECPFFNSRAIFECTLAALNLRERRQQPKLDTVDPSRIIPFPAAMVVYVHVEAERQCITPAEMGLRMLRLPQFQPAAKHLRRLYGLAGEQRIPDYEDAQVREALWQEEKKLLLHAA